MEKYQISVKNLNNLWRFIEIYAVFVLNLCGEKWQIWGLIHVGHKQPRGSKFSSTELPRWGWSFCHCQTSRTHEGCSCSRLGPEVAFLVFFNWNKWKLCCSADFFPPRQTRQFNFGKLATNSKKVSKKLASKSFLQNYFKYSQRSVTLSKQQFAHRWLLADTSWRCQVLIHRMTDHHHCIEGNLSAALLALGRLCELGWQCSGLESNRGDLHKVFLKPRSGILLK